MMSSAKEVMVSISWLSSSTCSSSSAVKVTPKINLNYIICMQYIGTYYVFVPFY